MNALPEGSEPSKLGRKLCISCVTSVTEEDVYISKEKCFPLYMFSGGRSYSFKNRARDISIELGF